MQGCQWFPPHHGVKAEGKSLKVSFNFEVEFPGYCLNDELLKDLELMNLSQGVLIRNCTESVAYSADLEACFHQIQIPLSIGGIFVSSGGVMVIFEIPYQMFVHPFRAVSSPSEANYIVNSDQIW